MHGLKQVLYVQPFSCFSSWQRQLRVFPTWSQVSYQFICIDRLLSKSTRGGSKTCPPVPNNGIPLPYTRSQLWFLYRTPFPFSLSPTPCPCHGNSLRLFSPFLWHYIHPSPHYNTTPDWFLYLQTWKFFVVLMLLELAITTCFIT